MEEGHESIGGLDAFARAGGRTNEDHLSRSSCLDMRCTAVPVNLRASEMREVGWNVRASRGNTETSADFGCLNITFLVSFVPSSYDRSISKHPILKPGRARHGTLLRNGAVGPKRISGEILLYISSGSSRTRSVHFSRIIRKMRRYRENNANARNRRPSSPEKRNLIPPHVRAVIANLRRISEA